MSGNAVCRVGVVDCGTNTFTLHIADCFESGQWQSVFRQKRFVRLGLDSFRSGRLSPQRFRRGLDVLRSFHDSAANFNVDHVQAFGCSALRDASNGQDFVQEASETGWNIEVLDGAAEAQWIHLGVRDSMSPHPLGDAHVITVDIGGGSVEFILWNAGAVLGRWSLDLGVARLTDWIKPANPLRRADIESVFSVTDAALTAVLEAAERHPPTWMVGTSGAFNSLMSLQNPSATWDDPAVADEFSKEELLSRCAALSRMDKTEIGDIPGMHPDRVPYMAVACVLIGHLLTRFPQVQRVFRSRNTLAEGVIVEAAAAWSANRTLPTNWAPLSE